MFRRLIQQWNTRKKDPIPREPPMDMVQSQSQSQSQSRKVLHQFIGPMDLSSMGGVFSVLVMGCIFLAAGLFCLILLIALYALFARSMNNMTQNGKLSKTPILIQDTVDYQNMDYIFNNPNKDPALIYFQQTLLSNVFALLSLAVFLLFFQGAVYISMSIWYHFREQAFQEKFIHSPYVLGLGVILLLGANIMRLVYKGSFLNQTQTDLRSMAKQYGRVKDTLYNSFILDTSFLAALTQDDTFTLSTMIQNAASNFSSSKDPVNHTLIKMGITYNVYKFLEDTIPMHNRATNTIREVFTADGIKRRSVLLPTLFIYQVNPIIPNRFYADFEGLMKQNMQDAPLQTFAILLSKRMQVIDTEIGLLPNIEKAKKLVNSYLWKNVGAFLGYVAFIIVLFFVYRFVQKRMGHP
jgi:hypothetical protein